MKPNCNIFILKKDYCYYFTPSLISSTRQTFKMALRVRRDIDCQISDATNIQQDPNIFSTCSKMSTKRKYSNNMDEAVKTICQLCLKQIYRTSLRNHTKSIHKMSIGEYKQSFGKVLPLVEEIFHKCKICFLDVYLDSDDIAKHLKTKHTITHREYNQKHIMNKNTRFKKIKVEIETNQTLSEEGLKKIVNMKTTTNSFQRKMATRNFEEMSAEELDMAMDCFLESVLSSPEDIQQ